MSRTGAVVVAAAPEAAEDARGRALAGALAAAGHDTSLLEAPHPGVAVTPGFLATSYRLYHALRGRPAAPVVFEDRGGHAFCAAAARRLGLSLEATPVVVRCRGATLRAAEEQGRAFLTKNVLGTAIAERLAIELADAIVCEDRATLAWMESAGWSLPTTRAVATLDDAEAWRDVLAPAAEPEPDALSAPLVSVVVPRHERTAYLPLCLDGLARQTYERLEVIVADDGSVSPAAAAQLDELEARSWPWPLRVLRLAHDGPGAARNAGFRAARGELVVFVDDDDVPFDELVSTLVRGRARARADVVAAGARYFHGDGAPAPREGDVVRIPLGRPRELGVLANHYGGPTCLWPRELLERLEGFRTGRRISEDWELLARATLAGATVIGVPEPLYWYRRTPGSLFSAEHSGNREETLAELAALFGSRLPDGARLLPLLATGAYEELERRKRGETSTPRRAAATARLLARRARQIRADSGVTEVVRSAIRFAGRLRSSG